MKLLIAHGGVDWPHLPQAAVITLHTLLSLPSRMRCSLQYGRRIQETEISLPPVFVIGHWRSGTTFLHELLSQDPALTAVTLWQAMAPSSFLTLGFLKPIVARLIPTRRPMDAVEVKLDAAYEEEAALAALGRRSFFHCFYFPRHAERQFRESVLFDGLETDEIEQWKASYLWFLKAVTFASGNRRIVLKNPANTARVGMLVEMFPGAHFIHVYRNPYLVYQSTRQMRLRTLGQFGLQRVTAHNVERQALDDYVRLMKRFFEQKHLIPENNLFELRYEDLETDPIGQMRKAYAALGLEGFDTAKRSMQRFVDDQAGYRKNHYKLDEDTIRRIEAHWNFTIERWGYEPPERCR